MITYTKYVVQKQICSSIYFNAGTLISCLIFLFTDKQKLELGKALATIALLGYVFNFSVIYSDFALEACYMIVVLTRRIDTIVIENIKY